MTKKLLGDSFFGEGDIIDRIVNEQDQIKKEQLAQKDTIVAEPSSDEEEKPEDKVQLNDLADHYHISLFNNEEGPLQYQA